MTPFAPVYGDATTARQPVHGRGEGEENLLHVRLVFVSLSRTHFACTLIS